MKKYILMVTMLLGVVYSVSADQLGVAQSDIDRLGNEPTLCKERYDDVKKQRIEQPIFSCKSGDKVISYCLTASQSKMSMPDDGYITYRFGKEGAAPEMEYPKNKLTVGQAFHYASVFTDKQSRNISDTLKSTFRIRNLENISKIESYEKRYNTQLPDEKILEEFSFSVGSYRYTLWATNMSLDEYGAYPDRRPIGLTVEYKDKVVQNFLCDNPAVGSYGDIFGNKIFDILGHIYLRDKNRDKQTEFRGVSPFIRLQN